MKKVNNIFITFFFIFIATGTVLMFTPVSAAPYGIGVYDAVVPYGNQTSLTINASNVTISAQASSAGQLSTASNAVTVYSTDVHGYKLYLNAASSASLTRALGGTIPASANTFSSPAALATNTWGYNTDASTNFIGVITTPILVTSFITNFSGPSAPSVGGSVTTVTYGVKLDYTEPAGTYSTNIMYTAVPQTT